MLGLGLGLEFAGVAGSAPTTPLTIWGASAMPLWLRGDSMTTGTLTDKSGNGHDATSVVAGTPTTLGGQPAINLAGGANYRNTLSSLVSAGSIYTVLAVAQAADATAGAVFCVRLGTPASDSLIDAGTLIASDLTAVNVSLTASVATEAQSPFLAQWSYPGAGSAVGFRLNRTNRTTDGHTQQTESGTTGFLVGTDPLGNTWKGKLAELVILNRAPTSPEQTAWESYVLARYLF